ncbi:MAG: RIP metalloprotease RseP [Caldisericaceae bacterium]|nr:RIP metalloprotease RseP [Caldisericaceae bacterium]RLD19871.1 MAG: RIP metalloprotease RseP [Caldisericota bacterium]RLF43071.1 MAG: RIP metalloprotease RseP [Thermoplasmata archaeon]
MNLALQIVYGIIIIGIIALVHEFGHFFAAKKSGIAVEEFSIGFGPSIFRKKIGGTEYKVGIIPILGYAKFRGMDDNLTAPDGFYTKTLWQRFISIFMGPGMNFIFAIIIFAIVFASFGNPFVRTTTVSSVMAESPAYMAGMQQGDKIIEIDGEYIDSWEEMTDIIHASDGRALQVTVEREAEKISLTVTPEKDPISGVWVVGVYSSSEKCSLFRALWEGVVWTGKLLYQMIVSIPLLFTMKGITSIAGPIGIAAMTGQAASGGFANLLWFSGFISIAIGFTNLLPIPALDGSWIILILWEAITHKPVPPEKQLSVQGTGFIIILGIMFLVSIKDIMRLISR